MAQKARAGRPGLGEGVHRINMSFDEDMFAMLSEVATLNGWSLAETAREMIKASSLLQRPVKLTVAGKTVFVSKEEAQSLLQENTHAH